MVQKIIICFIACIASFHLKGQEASYFNCDSLYNEIAEPKLTGDLLIYPRIGKGSQYFIEDWLNGTVLLSTNITVKNKQLRYNGLIDRIVWQEKNFQQVKLDKELVVAFWLNDEVSGKSYYFQKIKIKEDFAPDSSDVYAQVLCSDKLTLFAYRKVVVSGSEPDRMRGGGHFIDVLEKRTVYYFKLANKTSIGFSHINRRIILKIFPDKRAQVINLLKISKQHSYRTEYDLINITQILNKLF
jgi:hypothetical protein